MHSNKNDYYSLSPIAITKGYLQLDKGQFIGCNHPKVFLAWPKMKLAKKGKASIHPTLQVWAHKSQF